MFSKVIQEYVPAKSPISIHALKPLYYGSIDVSKQADVELRLFGTNDMPR